MSKTHELRKKASAAVRDRNWDVAIQLYERICGQDSGNGSPRNELGDIYLKNGDVENAIAQFQEAARLYHEFGLTNNAVAVHKKILRHDPNHLHSLWVLGEIRLAQGLDAEASTAFLDFLARGDNITEGERDAFVSRGLQLLEKMPDDTDILSRLEDLFTKWDQGQEKAQVLIAKARLAHEAGEFEVRDKYVEHAREAFSHLDALPDFVAFHKEYADPPAVEEGAAVEADAVDLDGDAEFGHDTIVIDDEGLDDPGEALRTAEQSSGAEDSGPQRLELDELDIDLGFDFDESELSGAAERVSGSVPAVDGGDEISVDEDDDPVASPEPEEPEVASPVAAEDSDAAPETEEPAEPAETVDLLSEILADDSFDVKGAEQSQIDTIEEEMRGQIGGQVDAGDHAGQYELGIVYMDMGLFDQAIVAFDAASEGEEQRSRALEMKGTCLVRQDRHDEARSVFEKGLAAPDQPDEDRLGLLYGLGVCLEAQGNVTAALEHYERVAAVDQGFADVTRRLADARDRIVDPA